MHFGREMDMTTTYDRPVPVPDLDSAPFWEGCKRHQLLFQRCMDCGMFRFPPNPVCQNCRSRSAAWVESAGTGSVYSWIVVAHPVWPIFKPYVPYAVALVDMDEGVRLAGNILDLDPQAIQAGMRVQV